MYTCIYDFHIWINFEIGLLLSHGRMLVTRDRTHDMNQSDNTVQWHLLKAEADLGMFSMFGRTGAPQKGGPQRPEIVGRQLSNAESRVSTLNSDNSSNIAYSSHRMFLYINVRKFMWGWGPRIFTEQGQIGFKSGPDWKWKSLPSTRGESKWWHLNRGCSDVAKPGRKQRRHTGGTLSVNKDVKIRNLWHQGEGHTKQREGPLKRLQRFTHIISKP